MVGGDEDGRPEWLRATMITIPLSCGLLSVITYQSFWGLIGAFFAGWVLVIGLFFAAGFLQKLYCESEWGETEEQLSVKASQFRSEVDGCEKSLESLRDGLYDLVEELSKYWDKELLNSEISQRKSDLERLDTRIRDLGNRLESIRSRKQSGLWTSWEGWGNYWGYLVLGYIALVLACAAWADDKYRGDAGGFAMLGGLLAIPLVLNIAWAIFFIQRKSYEQSPAGKGYSWLEKEEGKLQGEIESVSEMQSPIRRFNNSLERELRSRVDAG